jgi:hypothetical protein
VPIFEAQPKIEKRRRVHIILYYLLYYTIKTLGSYFSSDFGTGTFNFMHDMYSY